MRIKFDFKLEIIVLLRIKNVCVYFSTRSNKCYLYTSAQYIKLEFILIHLAI